MLKFVVCLAYYSGGTATEKGQIVFLGDKKGDKWVSNFENTYFFDTQNSANTKATVLNNNSADCGFFADSIFVIAVSGAEFP
ncbi:hypothetical protein [Microcoleus sp. D2_18a_D3]|uniref:hypothetical protein n=1 Tax=Microcoleus sp. D2_18a_D3 TaxID=3055330 RepID=UPI002FD311EA